MINKNHLTEIHGRIYLGDITRKYSRLGIFEKKEDREYICLERVMDGESSTLVYLPKTKENESFANNLNPGDVIRARGEYIENYFIAENVEVLSKSFNGRKSTFFDTSKEIKMITKQKGEMLRQLRHHFESNGFLETITPSLLSHYEGGDADPFVTESINGKKYFLKETNELILRRLLSANVGKVYEIGKSFRNIGINGNSLNEFTVVESAIPYATLEEGINFSEDLLKKMIYSIDSNSSLLLEWKRVPFEQAFKKTTGQKYDPSGDYKKDRADLEGVLKELNGPVYLIGLPNEISPINKSNGTTLQEAVLVLNNLVYCDVCEFDLDKNSIERRFAKQEKRTGRINKSFLKFMEEGIVPGIGIAFGLERWMQYFNGKNIINLKNLGGVI